MIRFLRRVIARHHAKALERRRRDVVRAFRDASARRDTREMHASLQLLTEITHQALRAEVQP